MNEKQRVILVDDDITSIKIGKFALSELYDVLTLSSGEKLFLALNRFAPDLILLDADLPKTDGFEILRRLKADEQAAHIPVILVTARDGPSCHERALRFGAADIVIKPYVPALLQKTVERHLTLVEQNFALQENERKIAQIVSKRQSAAFALQEILLDTLAAISDTKDWSIAPRGRETLRAYTEAMIEQMRRMGVYSQDLLRLYDEYFVAAAQLHDLGKIIVRDSILQKPGKLTAEEFEAVKLHTLFGVKVIEQIEQNAEHKTFFDNAKLFAISHHERWDGCGYPYRKGGEGIPLHGRLMAIVDVYDALVSERPYKEAVSHRRAQEIIAAGAGTQFDPLLVKVFLAVSDDFAAINLSRKKVARLRGGL